MNEEEEPEEINEKNKNDSKNNLLGSIGLKSVLSLIVIVVLVLSVVSVYGYVNAFSRANDEPVSRTVNLGGSDSNFIVELNSYTGNGPLEEILSSLTGQEVSEWYLLAGSKQEQMSGQLYRANIEVGKLGSLIQSQQLVNEYVSQGMNESEAREKARVEVNNTKFVKTNFLSVLEKVKIGLGVYGTEKNPLIVFMGPNEMENPENKVIIPRKGVIIIQGQSYEAIYQETRTILEGVLLQNSGTQGN